MKHTILALCISLLIAACGGGSEESPTQESAKCTPVPVVRIQLFGDSTQWGYDGETHQQSGNNPTAILQRAMNARFGVGNVLVINRAVNGSMASDLLNGTDGLNDAWPGSVNAEITVANFGINEMINSVPIETYKADLRTLRPTVLETPSPTNIYLTVPGYPAAMRTVAAETGTPVADVDAYVRRLPNWQTYFADGIHPNAIMYDLIARNVLMPTLEPLVAKLRCDSH